MTVFVGYTNCLICPDTEDLLLSADGIVTIYENRYAYRDMCFVFNVPLIDELTPLGVELAKLIIKRSKRRGEKNGAAAY